eukprot:CAMPEP_0171085868 /NCGR_PEP_ID=MMETSP0766_2-20121228/19193_1 /TAXON_ID=439317 /ORGANISM="Gambierdiscus australes, Strain CAWD 149" /LENGTH=868 /DNA_ID=CAMNT_0011543463 /DNA_START=41 /DNA_END=2647 /DNA_ORIENTATION=-
MVLIGNLSTAGMLKDIGMSTNGWANVGVSLSHSMHAELEPQMDKVAGFLSRSIDYTVQIESGIDAVLSTTGATVDTALADFNITKHDLVEFKDKLMDTLHLYVRKLLDQVAVLMDKLMDVIKPALLKIGEWLESFGEKIQNALEEFGVTVDRVQKLFDQVMSKLSPSAGENEDEMLFNTYALIDTDNSGSVDADDLQSLVDLYGITAFRGSKAEELFDKYDADGQGGLDMDEYTLLVHDPSIPGIMATMLRTYATQQAELSGKVGAARMRDEVAHAVMQYMSLTCAKNMTKVGWIAQALTNNSLPVPFTADILREFALDVDNPNRLTRVDTAATAINEMARINATHVVETLKLMSNPDFWFKEGFDLEEQPRVVAHVVRWIILAPEGPAALRAGLGIPIDDLESAEENLPDAAFAITEQRGAEYLSHQRTSSSSASTSLYASDTSRHLRDNLLGGVGAKAAGANPDADAALRKGQHALLVTLEFASWLSTNLTMFSDASLRMCFDYSGESSGPLQSVANQVNGMIQKVQNFMNLMERYATPKGFNKLISDAQGFANDAVHDIVLVAEHQVEDKLRVMKCKIFPKNCTSEEKERDFPVDLSGAFTFLTTTLRELKSALPTVIDNLKFAKKEVSEVNAAMNSIMTVLQAKAPPLFDKIAGLYKALWVTYFTFFGLLTVGMLFYGFWASGWCGGPQPSPDEVMPPPPHSFGDRLRICCISCTACLRGCHDSQLCFWSVLILMEVIVLIIFVVSVVICIIGGLQAFMSAGCSQIYILGDHTICTIALRTLKTFLPSFWSHHSVDLNQACGEQRLLTCHLISEQISGTVKLSMVGGLVASVLSFEMLVEASIRHEQAHQRRLLNAEAKEAKEA